MQGNSSDAWEVGVNKYLFAGGPVMKSQSNLQTGFLKMFYLAVLPICVKENWLEANKSVQLAVGRVDWRTNRRMQLQGILGLGLVLSLGEAKVIWSNWAFEPNTHIHVYKPNDQSFCFYFLFLCFILLCEQQAESVTVPSWKCHLGRLSSLWAMVVTASSCWKSQICCHSSHVKTVYKGLGSCF